MYNLKYYESLDSQVKCLFQARNQNCNSCLSKGSPLLYLLAKSLNWVGNKSVNKLGPCKSQGQEAIVFYSEMNLSF